MENILFPEEIEHDNLLKDLSEYMTEELHSELHTMQFILFESVFEDTAYDYAKDLTTKGVKYLDIAYSQSRLTFAVYVNVSMPDCIRR